MDLVLWFKSSMMAWIVLAGLVWIFKSKLSFLRGVSNLKAALVILLTGVFVTGVVGLGSLGFSAAGTPTAVTGALGSLSVKMHDGLVNATTTSDHVNDAYDVMTFYVADANIADGEEIIFNVTLERSDVSSAGSVTLSCTIPDKELSGVTADNIAEKTSGKVDLDINDAGTHADDNTVSKVITFAEGTAVAEVQVAFDQEETWEDGMTAYDEYAEVKCTAGSESFKAVIYAAD